MYGKCKLSCSRGNDKIDKNCWLFWCIHSIMFFLGFAEDYNKFIVNAKHELILTRSTTDSNAFMKIDETAKAAIIKISNTEWLMPYVKLSAKHKVKFLEFIA